MRKETEEKEKLELKDTVVSIKRISKTVKGGRTMRFSALVVVGDGNGSIGVGHGKSAEIPEAIRKGKEQAMRNIVKINLDNNRSVPHDYVGIWGTSRVLLKRSKEGTGVIAGGPVRSVMEMAGIQNIRTKSLGSRNKNNVALATINGLMNMKSPSEIATLRGKDVKEILAGIGEDADKETKQTIKQKAIRGEVKWKRALRRYASISARPAGTATSFSMVSSRIMSGK